MKVHLNTSIHGLLVALLLIFTGCGSTALISTPVEKIDATPLKISDLTKTEKEHWGHTDLVSDTIPGMSVDKAYEEIIKNRKGKKVVVAVLDSGIDLKHEDLDGVLWTNSGEKAGNGRDDDNNGYIDDVHGYNFLGESYNEQLEFARILRLKLGDAALQAKAKAKLDSEYNEAVQNKQQYEQILQAVKEADAGVKKHLGKNNYTKKEVAAIKTEDQTLQRHISVLMQMYSVKDTIPEVIDELTKGVAHFSDQLNYNLKVDFDGRKVVGDDPYNINDINYGNGNPQSRSADEIHGTHVAGIIAAERNNGKGIKGVANNVQIMSVRAVPNGDEYDKDIALGIRYAVDNGAQVINASFGKSFSPNAQWVYDAIKYAADKNVLIVHAAGNDGLNMDDSKNNGFPNDHYNHGGTEFADNVLEVGSLDKKYGAQMVSTFSNYGNNNVDIFAPGTDIYSTNPNNAYEYSSGTSFAAPGVSGVAALLLSYYPNLTASQVKKIIMESGISINPSVILGGNAGKTGEFKTISKSGKIANAYNALIMAENVSTGKLKL